jgi:hypothetical protein
LAAAAAGASVSNELVMWTIYDHPTDIPDSFVARKSLVGAGTIVHTAEHLTAPDLDQLRKNMCDRQLYCIPRYPGDDPNIVEVWISQCLCEHRHCILSAVWDEADTSQAQAEAELSNALTQLLWTGTLNKWCRICRSETFHYEAGRTTWRTIEEATPELQKVQAANIASGDLLEIINKATRESAN